MSIDERRKSPRTEIDETAYISISGSSTRCRIVNISNEGAALDVPDASFIPTCFQLMTESDRLVKNCRIAWIKQNRIGVEFETGFEMPDTTTHPQRQFLQYLRDGVWRRAVTLPDSTKVIATLLGNGWIERDGVGKDTAYRITPKGLAAKTTPKKI
jgi:hypothetical protein